MVSGNWHFINVNTRHQKSPAISLKNIYISNLAALKTLGKSQKNTCDGDIFYEIVAQSSQT